MFDWVVLIGFRLPKFWLCSHNADVRTTPQHREASKANQNLELLAVDSPQLQDQVHSDTTSPAAFSSHRTFAVARVNWLSARQSGAIIVSPFTGKSTPHHSFAEIGYVLFLRWR
jgi:hypothetical protein